MIPVYEPLFYENERKYVNECLDSNWLSSGGKYNKLLEEGFASYCGVKYGVCVPSGTAALHLAVSSLGIKEGDEVIIPNFTMMACALSVIYTGAKPVFVDAEPKTFNIDPEKIKEKITEKTKAIMPVHIYGHPCDMDKIIKIAKDYNLYVIEDAAEAHGALFKGKKVGSFGSMSAFSFYSNKIITTGEGGIVVTDDLKLAERARWLANFCFDKERRYVHNEIGFKYPFTNVQAAIGFAQLEKIEETIQKKRDLAKKYNELLRDIPGIQTPHETDDVRNVYWMYGILIKKEFGFSRDEVKRRLFEKGVDTRFFFTGMHKQPSLKKFISQQNKFPVSEMLETEGLYLPSSPNLTDEQIKYIVSTIKQINEDE
jgi:perosamine synthetase